jgi:hypothetical protein
VRYVYSAVASSTEFGQIPFPDVAPCEWGNVIESLFFRKQLKIILSEIAFLLALWYSNLLDDTVKIWILFYN